MKKIFVIFIIIFSFSIFGKQYSQSEIINLYPKIFHAKNAEYKGRSYVDIGINKETDKTFSKLIKDYNLYLDYILINSKAFDTKKFEKIKDNKKMNKLFIEQLKSNSHFNKILIPLISKYLISQGNTVKSFVSEELKPVSIDSLIKAAVRFFYPHLGPEGKVFGHICVGINGFKDYKGIRDTPMEAFCFASIFNELMSQKDNNLSDDFTDTLKKAKELLTTKDKEKMISRIQGAVWFEMSKKEKLKRAILDSYEVHKTILPFKITKD